MSPETDTVEFPIAVEQIGAKQTDRLAALNKWLYSRDPSPPNDYRPVFRPAPSIVVRTECELFGISCPRFAYRAYLAKGSFINVRRLELLAHFAHDEWSTRKCAPGSAHPDFLPYDRVAPTPYSKTPSEVILEGSCIADSVLVPPERLTTHGYHVLTADLARAYGEAGRDEPAPRGTPFVNHVKLGGGLCAQATCYMATLLLEEFACGIHGLAEVTSVVASRKLSEFNLGGMALDDMIRYFRSDDVGLYATKQQRGYLEPVPTPESADLVWLSAALRAYVASGMPVILPVDLGRMYGCGGIGHENSIFCRNNLKRDTGSETLMSHAVVVVGYHRSDPHEFVLCDPATRPFMRARVLQLYNARPYRKWGAAAEERSLRDPAIVPATPAEVRLPLMDEHVIVDPPVSLHERLRRGLFRMATHLLDEGGGATVSPFVKDTLAITGECEVSQCEFRLVETRRLRDAELDPRTREAISAIPTEAVAVIRRLVRTEKLRTPWLWLQLQSGISHGQWSVWLWNATQPSISPSPDGTLDDEASRYLIGAILSGSVDPRLNPEYKEGEAELELSHTPDGHSIPTRTRGSSGLKPSLISSFRTRGASDSARHWPRDLHLAPPACELYAFMQPEIDKLTETNPPHERMTAMQFMACHVDNDAMISDLAERLSRSQCFDPSDTPIVAVATFLPGVSAEKSTRIARKTRRALRFVARLASALRKKHDVRIVELVSGSTIEGIWPTLPKDPDRAKQMLQANRCNFMANWIDDDTALTNLLQNLRTLIEDELHDGERSVKWALELEPGPLFVVRDWETLTNAARRIDGDKVLSQHVFFNLDIAHWRLASAGRPGRRITPSLIMSEQAVLNRIAHAHIAGHHPYAHFGDLELDAMNEPEEDFGPWLDLLAHLAQREDTPYDGYVSVELEATRRRRSVENSLRTLTEMI